VEICHLYCFFGSSPLICFLLTRVCLCYEVSFANASVGYYLLRLISCDFKLSA
jgi:hypothetical protein